MEVILRSGRILAGGQHGSDTATLERKLDAPLSSNERYLASVACFADIPVDDLKVHTDKYGMFGLSLRKDFLIRRGVRPVLYVPLGGATGVMGERPTIDEEWDDVAPLVELNVIHLFGGRTAAEPGSRDEIRIEEFLEFGFLTYIKFFDPSLSDADPDNFYMEREWRSVSGVDFDLEDVVQVFVARGWSGRVRRSLPALDGRIHELA